MKKIASFILSITLCFSIFMITPTATKAATNSDIHIIINGNELSLTVKPQIKNGNVLVPMRNVLEAMGATVCFDSVTKAISAMTSDTEIAMNLGNKTMYKNGTAVTIAPPILSGSTILVPVRAVVECLNAEVVWNSATNTVCIFDYDHANQFACYKHEDGSDYNKLPDFGMCCGNGRSIATSTTKDGNKTISYYVYNTSALPSSTYFWTYYTNLLTQLGFTETTDVVKGTAFFVYTKDGYTIFVPSTRYDHIEKFPITVVYEDSSTLS